MQDSGPFEITAAGPGITLGGETTMKRTLISLAGLLAAASLLAATEKPATPQTTTAVPDSPLVAAAKKSKRPVKTRIVITDESVKNSKGHISTTRIQSNFNVAEPQKSTEEMMVETKAKEKERSAENAKLAKAAAEEKQKEVARAAAAAEDDGPYQVDPASVERQMEQQASPAATSTSSQPQPSKRDNGQRP